jgi:hypothetical protein
MKNQLASNSQFDYMYAFKDLALEKETKMFQLSTCTRLKSKILGQSVGTCVKQYRTMSRLCQDF